MADKQEKLIFTTEDQEEVEFFIIEQTMINGINYLLVADGEEDDDEANALILKERSIESESDAVYDIVEDEEELVAISKVFVEILEDIDIQMQ